MSFARTALFLVVLCSTVFAVDLKVDATFNAAFSSNDRVMDVHLLGDGRMLVSGAYCVNSSSPCTPFVIRLNANGTLDNSFSVPITGSTSSSWNSNEVSSIRPLAGGKFLITGDFKVGNDFTNYARINADGSIDATMQLASLGSSFGNRIIEPTPEGKFIVCAGRTINGENYNTAHRMNSDGTPDASFRVTFFVGGYCSDVQPLQDGKILLAASTWSWDPDQKPLHRLNSDGSKDMSFNGQPAERSYVEGLTLLPDGKIMVSNGTSGNNYKPAKRLLANGALDLEIPLCSGSIFLPMPDGSTYVGGCKRWQYYFGNPIQLSKVYADGSVDQKLDNIVFENHTNGTTSGFRDAGNGKLYVYGAFQGVSGNYTKRKLVRLEPNTTPKRAKYDFDGDGRSDLVVYRPSNGYWYLNQSSEGIRYFYWGFPTDKVAAGHFDNDGKTDIAVYRDGTNSTWHAWSSQLNDWRYINIGTAGDKPMTGDFDDLGPYIEDQAVRGVRNGVAKWFIREGMYVGNPTSQPYEYTLAGELPSDKPVVSDFSGDSRDEFGYFQNGYWYTYDYRGYAPPQTFQWGIAGDIPVPGDYDGDRQDDYAIFRPSTGVWWIARSSLGTLAVQFGNSTDIPVPADYDGDGKQDIAIYRNGEWWQYLSSTGNFRVENWGTATDKPVQAQTHQ
ncbi:MAG TPA: FG-GAP-like repeat-containing protein [Pyrinomonadaceae bacterium]|nr:FG-GAP-like repeat-containing protein [Pyrinomonadaceae bacterium]